MSIILLLSLCPECVLCQQTWLPCSSQLSQSVNWLSYSSNGSDGKPALSISYQLVESLTMNKNVTVYYISWVQLVRNYSKHFLILVQTLSKLLINLMFLSRLLRICHTTDINLINIIKNRRKYRPICSKAANWSAPCDFQGQKNDMIRNVVMLLATDPSLEKVLKLGRLMVSADQQTENIAAF